MQVSVTSDVELEIAELLAGTEEMGGLGGQGGQDFVDEKM